MKPSGNDSTPRSPRLNHYKCCLFISASNGYSVQRLLEESGDFSGHWVQIDVVETGASWEAWNGGHLYGKSEKLV